LYDRIPSGNTFHESLSSYEEAGRHYGVTPCYLRLKDVKPGQTTVWAYVKTDKGYKRRRIPAPAVFHNRALYFTKGPRRAIERLVRDGKQIFNEWNRYGKMLVHELLTQDPAILPHLPFTRKATPENVKRMMQMFSSLVLKPDSGSIGKGIMKLEKREDEWTLDFPAARSGFRRKTITFSGSLPGLLIRRLRDRPYLVQQRIALATYRGNPFDLRVSVQRNETGGWQVTGMAAKVAKERLFLTNVAQGATVHTLEQVLEDHPHLSPERVRLDVSDLALRVAERLSDSLPHMADLGLDIGVTASGFPMFIECNGRDLRYVFREGNMLDIFRNVYLNPIGYAKYLLDEAATKKLRSLTPQPLDVEKRGEEQ